MKRLMLIIVTALVMIGLTACDTTSQEASTLVDEAFELITTTDWDRNIRYHEDQGRIDGFEFIASFYLCYEDPVFAFPAADSDRPVCVIGVAMTLIPTAHGDFHSVLKVLSFHAGYDEEGNVIISPNAFARSGSGPIFNRVSFFIDDENFTYEALREDHDIYADLKDVIRTSFLHDGVIAYGILDREATEIKFVP